MSFLIVAGTIVSPFILLGLHWFSFKVKLTLDALALLCAFIVAVTIGLVVEQSISTDTVFTTDVHKVLHNGLFLWTASYLGLYGLYRLLLYVLREYRRG
jgi:uncharacterized membrane protein YraQ (UPF0718 family)